MPDKQWNLPNRPPAEKKGGRHGVPLDCFGPGQNQGQGQYQMGVMPGSPQVAQMMPMPMPGSPQVGQMVPASPAMSQHSNMSGYACSDNGVPLDYLMAPQQYQQHQAQQQYNTQPYVQPPSPMGGQMAMPLQGQMPGQMQGQMQAQAPNGYPMMFAAQPSEGNEQTPVYMCVGMMPAGMQPQRQMQ